MKVELKQQFRIESARRLTNLPSSHPCSNLHGHSFLITLRLVGDIDPALGWLVDYHKIKELTGPLWQDLDHKVLNDVPGLENPTSELLAAYIYNRAQKLLPSLVQVRVSETPDTECSYPVLA